MNNKNLHRVFAFISFAVAFITYSLTVQESVPFWDCGEFSSAAIWQQVPHPPGTPLFLMVGKIFDVLLFWGDPAWRINMMSAVCSAATVLLLYLLTVKVINNFRDKSISNIGEAIAVYGSSFVGAAAFTFSDTFWFNAVESEVYAMATLFVALVLYLMMKWNEEADNPGHERYLILIAYLIGLSTGVHLLAVLTIFTIVFLVYFRKYETTKLGLLITTAIALVAFFFIYPIVVKWIPAFLAGHSPGRNAAHEYNIQDSLFLRLVAIGFIIGSIAMFVWGHKKRKPIVKLVFGSIVFVLIGYTTYTHILLRANADPPMNENSPKTFTELSSYIGREQYGNDPSWPRRVKRDEYHTRNYTKRDESGEYVYGPWHPPSTKRIQTSDGSTISVPDWNRVNVAGELAYMWKYQIVHMYFRYLGWNFVGKVSDVQDAGVAWFGTGGPQDQQMNDLSGYADEFPVRFFAIPLLFGLLGMFFHFNKDKKMASLYMVSFLMLGVLATLAQQQQEPQPRERDYFYAGSFMIWCMWIAIGVYSLIESLAKKDMKITIAAPIVLASTLLVPVNMAVGGWNTNDRTGNYIPFDYSYNILQSSEEDAIIFTNGDNDTFPVWYIQDVMGVRRDVRIVNLSLGNTLWYVYQLKHKKPWGAKKIPLTFSDESLLADEMSENALRYDFGKAQNLRIPVKREILEQYTDDEMILDRGTFEMKFKGEEYTEQEGEQIYLFRVQDKLVRNILEVTKFERPVYYSTTVGPSAFCGLEDYFRYEGMLMRVCPVPQRSAVGDKVDIDIMSACLLNVDNTDNFSKTPKYGFKLRNMNNPDVYYNPDHRRLEGSYRQLYTTLAANYLKREISKDSAIVTLDIMNKYISPEQFPMEYDMLYRVSEIYYESGDTVKGKKYAQKGIERANKVINNENIRPEIVRYEVSTRYLGPHRYAARLYEMMNDYQGSIDMLEKLLQKVETIEAELSARGGYESELNRVQTNIVDLKRTIDDNHVKKFEDQGKYQEALDYVEKKMDEYEQNPNQMNQALSRFLYRKYTELKNKVEGTTQANGE